jgi:hypothetical protein
VPGFTELINTGDIQRANQATLRQQFSNRLAVRPGVNTAALAVPAIQRFGQGTQLAVAERRNELLEDRIDFARSQRPIETAIGAVGLGASVLGVVRDRQQSKDNKKALGGLLQSFEDARARNEAFTRRFVANAQRQTQQVQGALQPPRAIAPMTELEDPIFGFRGVTTPVIATPPIPPDV